MSAKPRASATYSYLVFVVHVRGWTAAYLVHIYPMPSCICPLQQTRLSAHPWRIDTSGKVVVGLPTSRQQILRQYPVQAKDCWIFVPAGTRVRATDCWQQLAV